MCDLLCYYCQYTAAVSHNICSYELLGGDLSTECFLSFIYRPMKTGFTLFKNATSRELFKIGKKSNDMKDSYVWRDHAKQKVFVWVVLLCLALSWSIQGLRNFLKIIKIVWLTVRGTPKEKSWGWVQHASNSALKTAMTWLTWLSKEPTQPPPYLTWIVIK